MPDLRPQVSLRDRIAGTTAGIDLRSFGVPPPITALTLVTSLHPLMSLMPPPCLGASHRGDVPTRAKGPDHLPPAHRHPGPGSVVETSGPRATLRMCETICDVDLPVTSARPAEAVVVAFAPEVWGAALRCFIGSKAHTSDCAKSSRNSPPRPHGPSRYEAFLALALVELETRSCSCVWLTTHEIGQP